MEKKLLLFIAFLSPAQGKHRPLQQPVQKFDTSINQAGLPDRKFGVGGLVKQPFLTAQSFDIATGLALTPDKKIVVVGYVGDPIVGSWKIALVRYTGAGAKDTSFGVDGVVLDQFSSYSYDQINFLGLQSDGKLVVAGESRSGVGRYQALLARYTDRGVLDASFGVAGAVLQPYCGTGFYDELNALAVCAQQRITAVGYSKDAGAQKMLVLRYLADGQPDDTFGVGGVVVQDFLGTESLDVATAVATCRDGSTVVAGTSSDESPGRYRVVLARYGATGQCVAAFGAGGIVRQPFVGSGKRDEVTCMVVQPDQKILVAGFSVDGGGQKGLLMRYLSTGTLDVTFGSNGIVKQPFLGTGVSTDRINALALQPDGNIVVAGATNDGLGSKYFLARYDKYGQLDGTFGSGGIVKEQEFLGDGNGDELHDVVVTPDGGIIASGYTQDEDGSKLFIVRYVNPATHSAVACQGCGLYGNC